jgi:hypothetical protein
MLPGAEDQRGCIVARLRVRSSSLSLLTVRLEFAQHDRIWDRVTHLTAVTELR